MGSSYSNPVPVQTTTYTTTQQPGMPIQTTTVYTAPVYGGVGTGSTLMDVALVADIAVDTAILGEIMFGGEDKKKRRRKR